MALNSATFKTGATWAPTGGTDLTIVLDGKSVSNGISTVVAADTNLLTRRSMIFTATLPALPANANAYAKLGRNSLRYLVPFIAADGKLYTQSVRIETAFHAEYSDKNTVIADIAALVSDSDFTSFWQQSILT
jgi:hypothetical protein